MHSVHTMTACYRSGGQNFKPVILAVQNISRSVDNTQWQRLVEAGIAEEILECICRGAEIRTFSEIAKDLLDSSHVDVSIPPHSTGQSQVPQSLIDTVSVFILFSCTPTATSNRLHGQPRL